MLEQAATVRLDRIEYVAAPRSQRRSAVTLLGGDGDDFLYAGGSAGKVTRVNLNRFVWRFQIGPAPF